MTDQDKIKKKYNTKVKKLLKLNKAYFEKDDPIVSDLKFDELKKELISLSKKYPYLKSIKNLEDIVGSKPSKKFKKIKHSKPMLSLSNAFDKKNIIDFQKK